MNVVHAVLRNWDILQVIINFVKGDVKRASGRRRRDLVAVALVSRVLSDLALDVLWREIHMEELYSLFPMDIIGADGPGGRKSLTRVPATPQQWKRFDVYAPRIRKLRASLEPDDRFLRGLRRRYPTLHHPFVNLTYLAWSSAPSTVIYAITLICPTLTEILLSINELDEDVYEDDDAVADLLRSLGETCTRLKKFEYMHRSMPCSRSKAVEIALIDLIRQCRLLEDVHVPASRDILRSLATLPHLSKLQLNYAQWIDGSQLSLPIQADEWSEKADIFPVLDDLSIQYWHTVSSLTECFQGSGCFPRKSFTMWDMREFEQWSTQAITEFFRGILRPDRSEGLLVFWIDRPTDGEYLTEYDSWQALRSLFFIPNIHTLTLDGFLLDIDDADLEEIPRIWPKLHSLHLNIRHNSDYRSQISFQGLAHLSTSENLENLSLMLAPDSTISEMMLSPSTVSNSPLKHLKIHGEFPPVPPRSVAMFLVLHFPKLKSIETSYNWDKGEGEWMKEIQTLLDGVRGAIDNEECALGLPFSQIRNPV